MENTPCLVEKRAKNRQRYGTVGVAYDGTNIWVANYSSNTVSKINPS